VHALAHANLTGRLGHPLRAELLLVERHPNLVAVGDLGVAAGVAEALDRALVARLCHRRLGPAAVLDLGLVDGQVNPSIGRVDLADRRGGDVQVGREDESLGDEQVVLADLLDVTDLVAVAPVNAPAGLDRVELSGVHGNLSRSLVGCA
jgi:hypothetical protein